MAEPWSQAHDQFLRRHGKVQSCSWIAERLRRSRSSVHARAKRLGVDMTKRGEAHHAAKATRQAADMIAALNDAGYTPVEIHALLQLNLSRRAVEDICAGRTWQ